MLAARPTWTAAPRDVVGFVGVMAALFCLSLAAFVLARRAARAVVVIVAFAAVFRVILVFAGLPADRRIEAAVDDLASRAVGVQPFLLYDNDVWRYLWDGHVGSCGINPYGFSPNEIEDRTPDDACPLESDLWWDVFDRVYFPDYRTIYPPVAQVYFRALHALAPASGIDATSRTRNRPSFGRFTASLAHILPVLSLRACGCHLWLLGGSEYPYPAVAVFGRVWLYRHNS